MSIDYKRVKEEALREVEKEQIERAKERYKAKLNELKKAEKIVSNIKREIEDLEDELAQD